jgi:hypothetical protein
VGCHAFDSAEEDAQEKRAADVDYEHGFEDREVLRVEVR